MITFSQYLREIPVPIPVYSKGQGWHKKNIKAFKLFPVLMTILVMWGICAILTYISNLYPESAPLAIDDPARTDLKLGLISKSLWFRHPYPCRCILVLLLYLL